MCGTGVGCVHVCDVYVVCVVCMWCVCGCGMYVGVMCACGGECVGVREHACLSGFADVSRCTSAHVCEQVRVCLFYVKSRV